MAASTSGKPAAPASTLMLVRILCCGQGKISKGFHVVELAFPLEVCVRGLLRCVCARHALLYDVQH